MLIRLALKVDVDTDRGTREGVPKLVAVCRELAVPACFLFSLGPDQTGRAITRVLRPGFLRKVKRTSVLQMYGWRTLLNGTLRAAPHIGRSNTAVLRSVHAAGFEVGIHSYNHYRWQDHLSTMTPADVAEEFAAGQAEFRRVFTFQPRGAGAAGWQSNGVSREVYERADLLYSSDTRGTRPYFPRIGARTFETLEIPTTLPTLDELLGRREFPVERLASHYWSWLREDGLNVFTVHAEIEGMRYHAWFRELLMEWRGRGVEFVRLDVHARELLAKRSAIPVCEQVMASIDGRSGVVATQGN
jgi:peptidoglycan/xylan/chitin deacetylase (PgdA/CDA1 family)